MVLTLNYYVHTAYIIFNGHNLIGTISFKILMLKMKVKRYIRLMMNMRKIMIEDILKVDAITIKTINNMIEENNKQLCLHELPENQDLDGFIFY